MAAGSIATLFLVLLLRTSSFILLKQHHLPGSARFFSWSGKDHEKDNHYCEDRIDNDDFFDEDDFYYQSIASFQSNGVVAQKKLEDRMYIDENGLVRPMERCILVGVEDGTAIRQREQLFTLEESMIEMRELIKTAGLDLVGEVTQRLNQVNPRSYIGTGKIEEANQLMKALDCCTLVFDAELFPGQQKVLEYALNKAVIQNDFLGSDGGVKVIDRTALILDIFAQRAKSREGKLQVELALHEYRKPRLTKMWTHLERQSGAGGVGLRGPGESQLEIDKRLLHHRIQALKHTIDDVRKQRTIHRIRRSRIGIPSLSLVGYTNAGKSSLFNLLSQANVMAESMLFATLDPTVRKAHLPELKNTPEVLLTDTVGFIQNLPTQLIAAFRATLEEVKEADVLIHVIDVSHPVWEKQEEAVLNVLQDIECSRKPMIRVLNKIDLLSPTSANCIRKAAVASDDLTVCISATKGDELSGIVTAIEQAVAALLFPLEAVLPYSMGDELSTIYDKGCVEDLEYRDDGTFVRARVPESIWRRLQPFCLIDSVSS